MTKREGFLFCTYINTFKPAREIGTGRVDRKKSNKFPLYTNYVCVRAFFVVVFLHIQISSTTPKYSLFGFVTLPFSFSLYALPLDINSIGPLPTSSNRDSRLSK